MFGALATQNDGKIVVASQVFNNQMVLSRFYSWGANDNSFDTNTAYALPQFVAQLFPTAMAIQPDGKIIVGTQPQGGSDGGTDFVLLRFNADGTLDTTFGGYDALLGSYGVVRTKMSNYPLTGGLESIALQTNGQILAAGYDFATGPVVIRYNQDGTLDSSFGTGGFVRPDTSYAFVYADDGQHTRLALQTDGDILLASGYSLYRLLSTGKADNTFGTAGRVFALQAGALTVDLEGKITLAGTSFSNHFGLERLMPDGSVDAHFGMVGNVVTPLGLSDGAEAVSVLNGRIIVSGFTAQAGSGYQLGVARYMQYNPAASYTVTTPACALTGAPTDLTVTVNDANGELVGDYTGTIHFTSSDPLAVLPADYTFTPADHGRHVFSGASFLGTPGNQTITLTDAANSAVSGSVPVMVENALTTTNDSGVGSLRQAILNAVTNPGVVNTIEVAIGSGPQSIHLLSPLPTITDSVVLDATGQPGYAGKPLIELDGSGAGAGANGLTITGANSLIKGFAINRFSGDGILITGAGATGNVIAGDYIGTDLSGTVALGNLGDGVLINGGASSNTIGGTTAGARNILSGNHRYGLELWSTGPGNAIEGNFIGTDTSGLTALPNWWSGMYVGNGSSNNLIGGSWPERAT
jgi:uncharacterized delta-60 repeat protein